MCAQGQQMLCQQIFENKLCASVCNSLIETEGSKTPVTTKARKYENRRVKMLVRKGIP